MILYLEGATSVLYRTKIHVTEPRTVLKGQTADPFVLDFRERLNAQISIEILPVRKALQTIVTFADARHTNLELADSSRNANVGKRPVIPIEHDA